jgi:hypothetical protein
VDKNRASDGDSRSDAKSSLRVGRKWQGGPRWRVLMWVRALSKVGLTAEVGELASRPDAVDIKPPLSENVDLDFDLNLFLAVSGISSPSAW